MTRRGATKPGSGVSASADRVVARPDGFYWLADDGEQEFGPFQTAAQALAAANEAIEATVDEERALQDVEAEIGVAERQDHDIVDAEEQAAPASGRG